MKLSLCVLLTIPLLTGAVRASVQTINLTDLDPGKITQGWGSPQVDKSVRGQPLSIAGRKFEHGLGTHAPMTLYVRVNGATRFQSMVGIDDSSGSTTEGSVCFKLSGDGKTLFESPVMKPADKSLPVDVDLKGVKILLLTVSEGADLRFDHADWADARFEFEGAKPEAVSPMEFGPPNLIPAGQGLQRARPAALPLEISLAGPVSDYVAVLSSGQFHQEYVLKAIPLAADGYRFEQKAGRSGSGLKPWIMLRSITTGKGVAAMLGYSGNWLIEVKPQGDKTLLRMDSVPSGLKPFTTIKGLPLPGALVADFAGEWDNGAIPITRFIRANLVKNQGDNWPLVQWNTWYDDLGYPTQKSVAAGAKVAADMGCEMVVVDAGWYGGKGHWENLCGDWVPNKERFPDGLEPAVKDVRSLGLKFGLWTEMESASKDSPVGKEHPDWLLRDGERIVSGRSVLDFGKPEVLAWAKAQIDRLMHDYQLDYIKNDFNTDLPVDSANPKYAAGDPLYRHYQGLNAFWTYVRSTYPKLIIENCSSGSLRHDLLTASQAGTHWVSDEVGNSYNLAAVFGATYLFPPETCLHWTCYPDSRPGQFMDLEAQLAANMMGHFGFSTKIYQWDEATRQACAKQIAIYKQIRPIIRSADVYHLTPQASATSPNSLQAALYVDPTGGKAVLYAFQGGADTLDGILKLRGLTDKSYTLHMPEGFGPDQTILGADLMRQGLKLTFPHKGASAIIQLQPAVKGVNADPNTHP